VDFPWILPVLAPVDGLLRKYNISACLLGNQSKKTALQQQIE